MNLRQKIEQEIREHGPLPFSRYMEMCLYDPELGYYSSNAEKFGKAGDFYTSSDVHAVFGRVLARQFEEMWRALGKPEQMEILELGPGRGLFAQDVLDWSEKKFPDFYGALHYTLEERAPSLREKLRSRFRGKLEAGKLSLLPQIENFPIKTLPETAQPSTGEDSRHSIESSIVNRRAGHVSRAASSEELRALPSEVPLIVFANEFFDALPVEVLSEKGSLRINVREQNFVEQWAPASAEELEFLDRYGLHPEGDIRTEVALLSQQQISHYAEVMQTGFFVVIDYGYTREEQLAGRHLGTIMAYRQHSASPNPYEAPGEQDITAHVNFTALAAAAEQNGMHAHKLRTQSQFLLGIGEANQFADAFEDCRLPQERAKVALQLKHLVTPAGMGETFHVLIASKGIDEKTAAGLSGMSFAKS